MTNPRERSSEERERDTRDIPKAPIFQPPSGQPPPLPGEPPPTDDSSSPLVHPPATGSLAGDPCSEQMDRIQPTIFLPPRDIHSPSFQQITSQSSSPPVQVHQIISEGHRISTKADHIVTARDQEQVATARHVTDEMHHSKNSANLFLQAPHIQTDHPAYDSPPLATFPGIPSTSALQVNDKLPTPSPTSAQQEDIIMSDLPSSSAHQVHDTMPSPLTPHNLSNISPAPIPLTTKSLPSLHNPIISSNFQRYNKTQSQRYINLTTHPHANIPPTNANLPHTNTPSTNAPLPNAIIPPTYAPVTNASIPTTYPPLNSLSNPSPTPTQRTKDTPLNNTPSANIPQQNANTFASKTFVSALSNSKYYDPHKSAARLPSLDIPFMPPSTHNGKPAAFFSDEEMDQAAKVFDYTLFLKFAGSSPSLNRIREAIAGWGLKDDYSVGIVDTRHASLYMTTEADYKEALSKDVHKIDDILFRKLQWTPDFDPKKESSVIPIWVQFPNLPFTHYVDPILPRVASTLGTYLKTDQPTNMMLRPKFARVCVAIDVAKPLPYDVWVDKGHGAGYDQVVYYESRPAYCTFCCLHGHLMTHCRKRLQSKGKEKIPSHDDNLNPQPNFTSNPLQDKVTPMDISTSNENSVHSTTPSTSYTTTEHWSKPKRATYRPKSKVAGTLNTNVQNSFDILNPGDSTAHTTTSGHKDPPLAITTPKDAQEPITFSATNPKSKQQNLRSKKKQKQSYTKKSARQTLHSEPESSFPKEKWTSPQKQLPQLPNSDTIPYNPSKHTTPTQNPTNTPEQTPTSFTFPRSAEALKSRKAIALNSAGSKALKPGNTLPVTRIDVDALPVSNAKTSQTLNTTNLPEIIASQVQYPLSVPTNAGQTPSTVQHAIPFQISTSSGPNPIPSSTTIGTCSNLQPSMLFNEQSHTFPPSPENFESHELSHCPAPSSAATLPMPDIVHQPTLEIPNTSPPTFSFTNPLYSQNPIPTPSKRKLFNKFNCSPPLPPTQHISTKSPFFHIPSTHDPLPSKKKHKSKKILDPDPDPPIPIEELIKDNPLYQHMMASSDTHEPEGLVLALESPSVPSHSSTTDDMILQDSENASLPTEDLCMISEGKDITQEPFIKHDDSKGKRFHKVSKPPIPPRTSSSRAEILNRDKKMDDKVHSLLKSSRPHRVTRAQSSPSAGHS